MVRTVIAEHRLPRNSMLRVQCVQEAGIFVYSAGFASQPERGDIVCRSRGIAICMPRQMAPLLQGTTIDFQDAGGVRGFTFENPNESGGVQASDPVRVSLSLTKLAKLCPEHFSWRARIRRLFGGKSDHEVALQRLSRHLIQCDSRAAVVVSAKPLLVAAYSDDLDCVSLVRFPDEFVEHYFLGVGSKLLTVNESLANVAADLKLGPGATGMCGDFISVIAEFLSDDIDRIEARKRQIADAEWRRTFELGKAALNDRSIGIRPGRPL